MLKKRQGMVHKERVEFREFVGELKAAGELVQVNDEVDWNLEASAVWR
jgi:3-polyprenyl-4-hydroxybenzoate decarboxylase